MGKFGKLEYKAPADSMSLRQQAGSGDVMCPGTEPCGP